MEGKKLDQSSLTVMERGALVGFKDGVHDQRGVPGVTSNPWLVVWGGGASAFASRERARKEIKNLKARRTEQMENLSEKLVKAGL